MTTPEATRAITTVEKHGSRSLASGWKVAAWLVLAAFAVLVLTLLSLAIRPAPEIRAEWVGAHGDIQVLFRADRATVIFPGDCLGVSWQVSNAQLVLLNGSDVPAEGEEACLNAGSPPKLSVVLSEGIRDYSLNVVVLSQHKLALMAAMLCGFLLCGAVFLTPPVYSRLQKLYLATQSRIQDVDEQVSTTTLLVRTQQFLRGALIAIVILFFLLYVGIALTRMNYPFELEWMEGASVDTVSRILNGQPLYTAPSVEYVPPIYGPVYFYVSALFSLVFGIGFFPLRLISVLVSLGCFAIIYKFVKRETGDTFAGVLAAGLFVATFNATGGWFDLARVDSLFLFFLLLGTYLVKFYPSPIGYLLAGIVFSLSILTKQAALVAIAPIAFYCLLCRPRLSIYLFIAMVVIIGSTTLLFDNASDGWYSYFLFGLAEQQAVVGSMRLDFWKIDMGALPVAGLLLIMVIYRQFAAQRFTDARFYVLLAVGMIMASWLMRLHSGGWVNGLFPAYAALALFFGVGIITLISITSDLPLEKRSPILVALYVACLLQFIGLLYDPASHIPTEQDRQAGNAFIERLANTEGDVLLFAHGYYAAMAGKPASQLGWSMVVLVDGEGPIKSTFVDSVNDAIAQQRFEAIVGDNATFLHEDFEAILNTYYEAELLSYEGAEFLPVTGVETRPTFLFTPRSSPYPAR
jgi:hypothetical protein